jgi:hypothetical protein
MALIYSDVTVILLCVHVHFSRVQKCATGHMCIISNLTIDLDISFSSAVCTEKQELQLNKNFLLLKFERSTISTLYFRMPLASDIHI